MPSFLIRDQTVERRHPEEARRAVGPGEHAARLLERLQDVLAFRLFSVRNSVGGAGCGRGRTPDVLLEDARPWHRITARSSTLASSRTLPGQS